MSLRRISSMSLVAVFALSWVGFAQADEPAAVGKWNITNKRPAPENWEYPSWIEIEQKDGKLQGRFLGGAGSVGDCGEVKYNKPWVEWNAHGRKWRAGLKGDRMIGVAVGGDGDAMTFIAHRAVWPTYVDGEWTIKGVGKLDLMGASDRDDGKVTGTLVGKGKIMKGHVTQGKFTCTLPNDRELKAKVKGDVLEGTLTSPDTKFIATREREYGEPIELFNGKNLDNWKPLGDPKKYFWTVEDGIMVNKGPGGSANIITKRSDFKDFKLHVEFAVPHHGNSGVYLRGRHEIQVTDSPGADPSWHICGALYSRIAPSKNMSKKTGEWQTFDITIVDNWLTVVHNGETVIDNKKIEGITGGAIDSKEFEPGPIYIQGDHGPVSYRKITLTPILAVCATDQ